MRHVVDTYRNWQPKYASYEIEEFDLESKREQAIIEMAGEAGEVLQLMTKARRKSKPMVREEIIDELGDTFWGLVGVMNTFDISWSELCDYNVAKLDARMRGRGHGR